MAPTSLPTLALTLFLSGAALAGPSDSLATALFAGGSFWCLEPAFESIPGVDSVVSGYTGGQGPNPDFESVSSGISAYVQAVRVTYHPGRVAYSKLLDAYWRNIDPTRADGQFSDDGPQYRPIIFHLDEAQKTGAEASLKRLRKSKRFSKPIVAEILPATVFHPAEDEHQDYYRKNAGRYKTYLKFSGREAFLRQVWGAKAK
jgi:peptide-methionine (S)-S-oxide reductase